MLKYALEKVRDGLVSIAYPQQCRVCSGPVEAWADGVACRGCWLDPARTRLLINSPVCGRCGAPLSGPARPAPAEGPPGCALCLGSSFAAARACGVYSGAVEACLLFLKSHPHICRRLCAIIKQTVSEHSRALACDVVMPVPLHRLRRRERGFNQAALVAKEVARALRVPVDERTLARVKHTERHRAGMDLLDRARSVKSAFVVTRLRLAESRVVLLVDDLFTTGSTVNEAARVLLKAGASRVNVLTVARAVMGEKPPRIRTLDG